VQRHHYIGGLDVAVDNALLMRVLHGIANRDEQIQSFFDGKSILVTEVRDWDPAH
jgi:hypothetical protein